MTRDRDLPTTDARDDCHEREGRHRDREPSDALAAVRETPMPSLESLSDGTREPVVFGRQVYRLRADDVRLLRTVGTFRVVYVDDLRPHHARLDRDLRTLREQALVHVTRLQRPDTHATVEVVSLTHEGRNLIQAAETGSQRYHSDVVRLREVHHDAQLWKVYAQYLQELAARGAIVERVRLDHELKHDLWSRSDEETGAANDIAAALGLPRDAKGHVQIPDLQLEVREADGRQTRCNLEFVTRHYSSAMIRAKDEAGFALHGPIEDPDRAARLFEF